MGGEFVAEQGLRRAVQALKRCQALAVFTGAGVSRASGLATYRDADGAWQTYDPRIYATLEGFLQRPREVWAWYNRRRQDILNARPNPAHQAIAALEKVISRVTVITQNIDGLHQAAGSSSVLELHGSFRRFKCSAACRGEPTPLPEPPLDLDFPPPCPYCGAWQRPDVVWFGEALPHDVWNAAVQAVLRADVLLVVGTSGLVAPAAYLPEMALESGVFCVEINPDVTPLTARVQVALSGLAEEVLPRLLSALES